MTESGKNIIETPRLHLISCDQEILKAILSGDEAISKLLNIKVAFPWSEAGEPAFRFSLQKITEDSTERKWWTYLPILKDENILIGSGGYKGKPSGEGVVEFGYEIAQDYRGRGLATEMARALIQQAFENPEVQIVRAHTLAINNASVSVLRKCGLNFINELIEPEDGKIWRWELKRKL